MKKSAKENPVKLGMTVLYRKSESDTFPMIVTRINDDGSVSGQAFLDGTERAFVENASIGDEVGEIALS